MIRSLTKMNDEVINNLRKEIDIIDIELINIIEKRQDIVKQILKVKNEEDLLIEDPVREKKIIKNLSEDSKLPKQMIKEIYNIIFKNSKKCQK